MATEFSAFMEEIEREAEAEGPTAVAELRHLQEAARDTRSAMHEPASAASAIAFSHGRPFLRACNYCGVETHERLAWQVRKPGATLGATAGDRSIACCEGCWEGLRKRQIGIAQPLTFGWARRDGGTWFCGFCTDRTDEFLVWHTGETLRVGADPNAHACCRRCRDLLKRM